MNLAENEDLNNTDETQNKLGQSKKQFMNTQKLPSNKAQTKKYQPMKKPAFLSNKKGLELQIEDKPIIQSKRPPSFKDVDSKITQQNKKSNLMMKDFSENDEQEEEKESPLKDFQPPKFGSKTKKGFTQIKGEEPISFANENVMSKSNLRQPKQFSFGFPAGDDSDSSDDSEELNKVQSKILSETEQSQIKASDSNYKEMDAFFAKNIPSSQSKPGRKPLNLALSDEVDTVVQSSSIRKPILNIGGTTGATSDNDYLSSEQQTEGTQNDPSTHEDTIRETTEITDNQSEEVKIEESQSELQIGENKMKKKQAVISYKKNAKLFTNANAKLNIDTEAINELFNYGGEKGQIMMSEDEEQKAFEGEIEELASMCIAAMNRKRATDTIKYEGLREKTTFESKYLKNENDSQVTIGQKQKSKNSKHQFMTPQSVRGIKKIEFSMSQEEKNAALEIGSSLGGISSGDFTNSKGFGGLKSGLFNSNTILEEELSGNGDSSKSSDNRKSSSEINFPGLLSASVGDALNSVNLKSIEQALQDEEEEKSGENKYMSSEQKSQSFTFAQIPNQFIQLDENINQDNYSKENDLSDSDAEKALMILNPQQQEKQIENSPDFKERKDFSQIYEEEDELVESPGAGMNLRNDYFTQELENLYTSCLEWIISRAPSSLYENIVIDECDKVGYQPAIQLLMTLVTYSNNIIRQRALTDLEMLAKWNPRNGMEIMMHPQFHTWLLELLIPYQDMANKYSKLQGHALAVYDIGCKLHTLLLKNACINSEEEAYKKINFLSRWPLILQKQLQRGLRDRQISDIETANKLSRVLLNQLILSLRDEMQRIRPNIGKNATNPTWHNFIYISSLVEEMILASNKIEIQKSSKGSGAYIDFNGQPLFKWIHDEDYLLYYFGSNEKSLWAEWDMLESLFQTFDFIYPEWTLKQLMNTQQNSQCFSIDEQIFSLLEKSSLGEEYSAIVDILVHDMSPYKSSQNQFQQPQPPQSKPKKGILGNVLSGGGIASHFKFSSSTSSPAQTQVQETLAQQLQSSSVAEVSFMRNILNMLCIALTQSDTKELVQIWLDRLERFTKFLMIVSETWKSRLVTTVYQSYQKKFTEVITFALAFLFHEIHSANRSTPTNQSSFNFNSTQQSSTQNEQLRFNKQYAQSLKNIMIFFMNIIEYSKIKNTPSQFESHVTACRFIFNNILVKTYSQYMENLISLKDISRFKQTDYEDFPECFYLDEWKVTFFNNEQIRKIVRKNLSTELLQSFMEKRQNYATHHLETQISNDKAKQDILNRMQIDTIEVIGVLSDEEFARKDKQGLLIDDFIRQQGHNWKHVKKNQISGKGMWKCEPTRLKMTWYRLNDGTRAIMEDCYGPSKFEYFKSVPGLEQKIFGESSYQQLHSLTGNKYFNLLLLESFIHQHLIQGKEAKKVKLQRASHLLEEEVGKFTDEDVDNDEDDEEEEQSPFEKGGEFDELITTNILEKRPPDNPNQVVQYFSRMLTVREKVGLKRQYVHILKEFLLQHKATQQHAVKFKEIIREMRCEILKAFYKRSGTITLTSHEIIFFDDIVNAQQDKDNENPPEAGDNIFFFKHVKTNDALYYKIIPLQELREVQRRRWLGRKSALEIFLMNGKTLLLNFNNQEDRETFAKKILRQRNQKCNNLKYYDTLEPRRILKKRELTERWMNWKISNFEYISLLNQLSGRSYNDLSQYPVIPWIVVDYNSQQPPELSNSFNSPVGAPPGFRDLNKNMQLLGSAERQAEFKKKYDDMDSFETLQDRFHCGSHYSNPGIVLHYLSRVSPYIDALVQLHGKNLDSPDRGFHSIHDSLNGALNDTSDVRELIPEFYFCPEMFINQNRIKFGVKQDGIVVDDVQLPPWSLNDPYLFVIFQREAFESQYVSQNLGGWIDYIFGFKQREQEAEKALNTFSRMTYEDGIEIDDIQDPIMRQGYQEQIYNYGQTPSQLFQKQQKHPQKLAKSQALRFNTVVDVMSKIKVYKPVMVQQQTSKTSQQQQVQQVLISNEAILRAKFTDDSTIVGLSKDGNVTYFFWLSKAHELNPNTPFTCCEDKKRKYDNRTKYGGLDLYDRSIKRFDFPLLLIHSQKYILKGGFWGGKIIISPIDGVQSDHHHSIHVHQSTVTSIVSTQNEKVIISGSKSGDVIIWKYVGVTSSTSQGDLQNHWQVRKHHCDHEAMISFIHINEEMNLYMTCSFDGTINLYNLWNDKFIRQFQHPKLSPIHSGVLTQTPLPAVCFFSREDHYWYSYSLNNNQSMLEKQKEESSHIISPLVIRDSHFIDRLVYGTEKGYLVFRQLPLLKQVKKQQVSTSYPVLSLIVSPDRRFLLVGCGDGGLNVVTEPYSLTNFSAQQTSNLTMQSSTMTSSTSTNQQQMTMSSSSQGSQVSARPSLIQ